MIYTRGKLTQAYWQDLGEVCGLGTEGFKLPNILWVVPKLTYPKSETRLQRPDLIEPAHSSRHVPYILNLAISKARLKKCAATSNRETAIVVFEGQSYPMWTLLVQSRLGLLNHALAVSPDPYRSPACWASCAGGRELEQKAGGRQPRACVSNLYSQATQGGCVRVCMCVFVYGGWGCVWEAGEALLYLSMLLLL